MSPIEECRKDPVREARPLSRVARAHHDVRARSFVLEREVIGELECQRPGFVVLAGNTAARLRCRGFTGVDRSVARLQHG